MNEDETPQKQQSYLDILVHGKREIIVDNNYTDRKRTQSLFCNNCGKSGHHFKCCTHPVTSLGIICFKLFPRNQIKYLYILRRHTYSYVELVRSKFFLPDDYIKLLITGLTFEEKNVLLHLDFDIIWGQLWTVKDKGPYLKDYDSSKESYLSRIDKIRHFLEEIELSNYEPEWGFPKGRRNYQEKDFDCALREFTEETGFSVEHLHNIQNILPFEEIFTGSNYKSYKHKYYLTFMKAEHTTQMENYERTEVSKMEWKTFDECIKIVRPYNLEKIKMITNINQTIKTFRLFSL